MGGDNEVPPFGVFTVMQQELAARQAQVVRQTSLVLRVRQRLKQQKAYHPCAQGNMDVSPETNMACFQNYGSFLATLIIRIRACITLGIQKGTISLKAYQYAARWESRLL